MNDWQTVELQDIAVVERGKFSVRPRNDPKYFGGDIPFLQTGDVAGASGAIISTYSQTLNKEGLKVSKYFPAGTLLITIAANIGDVAEVGFGFACTDSLVAVQAKNGIDKNWLKFFLQTQKAYFESRATQNAQANINLQTIRPLPVDLPSLLEQTTIANLLSTWDEAIDKAERLIAAKEKLYSGLSKKLLFGNSTGDSSASKSTRWFSVPEHWKIVKVGTIAKEVKTTNDVGDTIPVLSCTKYDGLVDSLSYFGKQVFSLDTSTYKMVSMGEFAYATNHIEEGSIGYQNLYDKGLVSPMYTVFKTGNTIYDSYLYKVLKTETYRHIFEVNTSASVDRRGSLRWNEFSKLPIPLPPIEEQKRIAAILDTARREIDLLKQQADALRRQKRGLMQKLLTGVWHIRFDKEVDK